MKDAGSTSTQSFGPLLLQPYKNYMLNFHRTSEITSFTDGITKFYTAATWQTLKEKFEIDVPMVLNSVHFNKLTLNQRLSISYANDLPNLGPLNVGLIPESVETKYLDIIQNIQVNVKSIGYFFETCLNFAIPYQQLLEISSTNS